MKYSFDVNNIQNGKKVYQVLFELGFSHMQIKKFKKSLNNILINDEPSKAIRVLQTGDKIELNIESKQNTIVPKINEYIEVLYEDEYLIAVNKPPFVSTIPNFNKPHLAGRVLNHLNSNNSVMPISRLDFNTSGVVLFAKTPIIQHMLTGKFEKTYLAIVKGIPQEKEFLIDKKIAIKPNCPCERIIDESGKESQTFVKLLNTNNKISLLEVQLLTGRTHQIRLHLASCGLFILGDELYGIKSTLISRQALHAFKVQFIHPISKKEICIVAPLCDDFKTILKQLD